MRRREKGKGEDEKGDSKFKLRRTKGKEEDQSENTEINGGGSNIDELEAFISKFFRIRYLVEKVQSELYLQTQLEMS